VRALIFDGELAVRDVPMPKVGEGEALIKVLAAGVCNTDLELVKGYMGFKGILGHEFVGIVEETKNPYWQGKRVVGEINCACHKCTYCHREMPHHCMDRSVLGILGRDGAFAEYLALPEENLHLAPPALRDDVAVFTEPTAAAFRILEQVDISKDDRIIVLGDGKLGQLIAQVLWLYSKNLVCVGRQAWKLQLLKDLGIQTARENEPLQGGVDVVVEATGSPEGFGRALELVRPEGTVILKTTLAQGTVLDLSMPVINEVTLLGSRCGPFRPALEALSMGNVEVTPMISEAFDLKDGIAALERAATARVMKILLHM
jgi:threonine dehydrogenase-like Zn-dependent dehydrogenase